MRCNLCIDLGLVNVIIEDDALAVVYAVNRTDENLSKYGHMVEESKHLFNGSANGKIQAVKRGCNQAAHLLAKYALLCIDVVIDLESILGYIQSVVLIEVVHN